MIDSNPTPIILGYCSDTNKDLHTQAHRHEVYIRPNVLLIVSSLALAVYSSHVFNKDLLWSSILVDIVRQTRFTSPFIQLC